MNSKLRDGALVFAGICIGICIALFRPVNITVRIEKFDIPTPVVHVTNEVQPTPVYSGGTTVINEVKPTPVEVTVSSPSVKFGETKIDVHFPHLKIFTPEEFLQLTQEADKQKEEKP